MLTRKQQILSQPWIDARYAQHRRNVRTASASVDVRPPVERPHVSANRKKSHSERTRQQQIERENGRLLQRLGDIMNTNRLDNFWRECRPNFLRRQPLFALRTGDIRNAERPSDNNPLAGDERQPVQPTKNRSASAHRCAACTGRTRPADNAADHGNRVPWAPERVSHNVKLNLAKVAPMRRPCEFCCL